MVKKENSPSPSAVGNKNNKKGQVKVFKKEIDKRRSKRQKLLPRNDFIEYRCIRINEGASTSEGNQDTTEQAFIVEANDSAEELSQIKQEILEAFDLDDIVKHSNENASSDNPVFDLLNVKQETCEELDLEVNPSDMAELEDCEADTQNTKQESVEQSEIEINPYSIGIAEAENCEAALSTKQEPVEEPELEFNPLNIAESEDSEADTQNNEHQQVQESQPNSLLKRKQSQDSTKHPSAVEEKRKKVERANKRQSKCNKRNRKTKNLGTEFCTGSDLSNSSNEESSTSMSGINQDDPGWENILQFKILGSKLKQKCDSQWKEFEKFVESRKKLNLISNSQSEEFALFLSLQAENKSLNDEVSSPSVILPDIDDLPAAAVNQKSPEDSSIITGQTFFIGANNAVDELSNIKEETPELSLNIEEELRNDSNSELTSNKQVCDIPNSKRKTRLELENIDEELRNDSNSEPTSNKQVCDEQKNHVELQEISPFDITDDSDVDYSPNLDDLEEEDEEEEEEEPISQPLRSRKSKKQTNLPTRAKEKTASRSDPQLAEFVQKFKEKRLELGFMQDDVAFAVGSLYGCNYSQTTISRFESFRLSLTNMYKLKPYLQHWLSCVDTVNNADCKDPVTVSRATMPPSLRKRKGRTVIPEDMCKKLEKIFMQNSYPSPERMKELAESFETNYEVVKIWFCNRRAKEKRQKETDTVIPEDMCKKLENFFMQNSYPSPEHMKELAENFEINYEVVKIWFCNRRAKEKRQKAMKNQPKEGHREEQEPTASDAVSNCGDPVTVSRATMRPSLRKRKCHSAIPEDMCKKLEKNFKLNSHPSVKRLKESAENLETDYEWFRNRREKQRKQNEMKNQRKRQRKLQPQPTASDAVYNTPKSQPVVAVKSPIAQSSVSASLPSLLPNSPKTLPGFLVKTSDKSRTLLLVVVPPKTRTVNSRQPQVSNEATRLVESPNLNLVPDKPANSVPLNMNAGSSRHPPNVSKPTVVPKIKVMLPPPNQLAKPFMQPNIARSKDAVHPLATASCVTSPRDVKSLLNTSTTGSVATTAVAFRPNQSVCSTAEKEGTRPLLNLKAPIFRILPQIKTETVSPATPSKDANIELDSTAPLFCVSPRIKTEPLPLPATDPVAFDPSTAVSLAETSEGTKPLLNSEVPIFCITPQIKTEPLSTSSDIFEPSIAVSSAETSEDTKPLLNSEIPLFCIAPDIKTEPLPLSAASDAFENSIAVSSAETPEDTKPLLNSEVPIFCITSKIKTEPLPLSTAYDAFEPSIAVSSAETSEDTKPLLNSEVTIFCITSKIKTEPLPLSTATDTFEPSMTVSSAEASEDIKPLHNSEVPIFCVTPEIKTDPEPLSTRTVFTAMSVKETKAVPNSSNSLFCVSPEVKKEPLPPSTTATYNDPNMAVSCGTSKSALKTKMPVICVSSKSKTLPVLFEPLKAKLETKSRPIVQPNVAIAYVTPEGETKLVTVQPNVVPCKPVDGGSNCAQSVASDPRAYCYAAL